MLFPRVSALGRALVVVVGLALSALGSTAHAREGCGAEVDAPTRQEQPAVEAHEAPSGQDLREGEHTRVVSSGAPSAPRPPAAGSSLAAARREAAEPFAAAARRWCDVVQCRRLEGIQLLGFATPPPTRG